MDIFFAAKHFVLGKEFAFLVFTKARGAAFDPSFDFDTQVSLFFQASKAKTKAAFATCWLVIMA